MTDGVKTLLSFLLVLLILGVGWLILHAWWVDTHCTVILGTQVCQ